MGGLVDIIVDVIYEVLSVGMVIGFSFFEYDEVEMLVVLRCVMDMYLCVFEYWKVFVMVVMNKDWFWVKSLC